MTIIIFIIIFTVLSYYLAKLLSKDIGVLPLHKQIDRFKTKHRSEVKSIDYMNHKIYYVINIENTFSGKISYVTLAIKSLSNEKFIIEKIGYMKRFLIWLKLIKSPLFITKNMAVLSDEETTYDMFNNKNIQYLLMAVFEKPFLYDTKRVIFSNENNEFSMKFKLNKTYKPKEVKIEEFIENYANEFVKIYEEIDFEELNDKEVSDTNKRTTSVKFGLIFLGVWGFFLSLIEGFMMYPAILEHSSLMWLSFKLSFVLSALVAMFVLKKVKHSIFKFSITAKFFFFGIVAFFAVSLLSIKYTNIFLDKSEPYTLVKTIKSKTKSKHPRYYFHCIDGSKINIDETLYHSKKIGDSIFLSTKKGYWNLEWIDDVK